MDGIKDNDIKILQENLKSECEKFVKKLQVTPLTHFGDTSIDSLIVFLQFLLDHPAQLGWDDDSFSPVKVKNPYLKGHLGKIDFFIFDQLNFFATSLKHLPNEESKKKLLQLIQKTQDHFSELRKQEHKEKMYGVIYKLDDYEVNYNKAFDQFARNVSQLPVQQDPEPHPENVEQSSAVPIPSVEKVTNFLHVLLRLPSHELGPFCDHRTRELVWNSPSKFKAMAYQEFIAPFILDKLHHFLNHLTPSSKEESRQRARELLKQLEQSYTSYFIEYSGLSAFQRICQALVEKVLSLDPA